jgi:iron complex transport system ATP-binding protein
MTLTSTSGYSLACSALTVEVAGRTLVRELEFAAPPGTMTCLLGCNGSGKTLTLHSLAGARNAAHGTVSVAGKPVGEWPRRELAKHLGLLAQNDDEAFPSTVLESVLVGRHPHLGFWTWESTRDFALAQEALSIVDLETFAERSIVTLSGGERRRAALATLLTQDPEIMLLDEPINHLDPHHQIDVMQLLRRKADQGRTIVVALHDAGLAARFADHALLLFGDGRWQYGPQQEILTEPALAELYGTRLKELRWEGGRTFVPA